MALALAWVLVAGGCAGGESGPGGSGAGGFDAAGLADGGAGGDGGGEIFSDGGTQSGGDGGQVGSDAGPGSDVGSLPQRGCFARSEVPDPVELSLSVSSQCSRASACGGELDGTRWAYQDVCLPGPDLFPGLYSVCQAATIQIIDQIVSGTLSFADGRMNRSLQVQASAMLALPNACTWCQCSQVETRLRQAGLVSARCSPVCSGGWCNCSVSESFSRNESDTYAVEGGTVTTASGATFEFCRSESRLNEVRSGSFGLSQTFALVPPTTLMTPEICDGLDNDRDGEIDERTVECPPACNAVGVCREGSDAVCNGERGWSCSYRSSAYEQEEQTCDGLDNDCDGQVDELEECVERCDGLDNDGDGTVDDSPVGPVPVCAQVGECGGAAAVCLGERGWACVSTDPDYEPEESRCDGLDNDCDGGTDEGCSCGADQSKLYFSYYSGANGGYMVARCNLDGSALEDLYGPTANEPFGALVVDPIGKRVYFGHDQARTIESMALDGSDRRVEVLDAERGHAIDGAGRWLYFSCAGGGVCRFDLRDGTREVYDPVGGGCVGNCVAVDSRTNSVFYTRRESEVTQYTLLRSTGPGGTEATLRPTYYVMDLIADPFSEKLYVTGSSGSGFLRMDYDGRNAERVQLPLSVHRLALDAVGRKVYWDAYHTLHRADLDGTGVESLAAPGGTIYSLAVYRCLP